MYGGGPGLPFPVEAWGGTGDETVTAEHLAGWRRYAAGPFQRTEFSGGHYFYFEHRDEILSKLRGYA